MADVFGEESRPLGHAYLDALLGREDFWAFAALVGDEIAGGVTAYELPLTRTPSSELFIYDVAVRPEYRRRGVGRSLIQALLDAARAAGVREAFVPADDEDEHALDFYRALGGVASPVTFYGFRMEDG